MSLPRRETVADETPRAATGSTGLGLHLVLCGEQLLHGGRGFDLTGVRELVIGRGDLLAMGPGKNEGEARLDVPDQTMSSRHARVRLEQGPRALIEDLGSRNGTRVRGERAPTAVLGPDDWFVLGRSVFLTRPARDIGTGDPLVLAPASELRTFTPTLANTFRVAAALAPSPVPLLLIAETGTGKEVFARALHELSGRKGKLVAVNCAALPETLVESELFGYRRGAFSDAKEDRAGLVRAAEGGTLLLDEVGDLPLSSQAKLLRFLQEGEVLALGATAPVQVDVRVVAATQKRLDSLVGDGAFRADLLGRLAGYTMSLPPLRERRADLGLLVAALLARHAGAEASRFRMTGDACTALFRRPFVLNVRELDRLLQSALVLAKPTGEITAEHLGVAPLADTTGDASPLPDRLRESLERHQGNVSAVAREMGKARMQIHRWMDQLGLDPARFRPPGRPPEDV